MSSQIPLQSGDVTICPACGKSPLVREASHKKPANKANRFRCKECKKVWEINRWE